MLLIDRDETEGRVADAIPGIRYFFDFDLTISRLYGAVPADAEVGKGVHLRRFFVVLDPTLGSVRSCRSRTAAPPNSSRMLAALPPPDRFAGIVLQAPVLFVPNVFEAGLCPNARRSTRSDGGEESGFMREVDGKTVDAARPNHKRRRDITWTTRN